MEFIGIAVMTKDGIDIGARLLEVVNNKAKDYGYEYIEEMLKKGYRIGNIELVDGIVTWVQGSSKRYPSIDIMTNKVQNKNSITVVSKYERTKGIGLSYYVVVNYDGKITIIDEVKLIKYGIKHRISNCKVISRNGIEYISAIKGNIHKIGNVIFNYRDEYKIAEILIPFESVDKIEIPKVIGRYNLSQFNSLCVIPEAKENSIKHLVLPEVTGKLASYMYRRFPKIEKLEIKGDVRELTVKEFKHLKYLKIHGISEESSNIKFSSSVEHIEFVNKPRVYKKNMFAGCDNLDVSGLFHEGLVEIQSEAFYGLSQLEHVELPRSLKVIDITAFDNCRNIKSLRINNNTLNMVYGLFKFSGTGRLLEDSVEAKVYCSYEFPKYKLDTFIAEHVPVIRDKPINVNRKRSSQVAKAITLGIGVREYDTARNIKESLGFLRLISEKDFKQKVNKGLRSVINADMRMITIENEGMYLDIFFKDSWELKGKIDIRSTTNYTFCISDKMVMAYLTSRNELINTISDRVKNGTDNALNALSGIYNIGKPHGNKDGFILVLPFMLKYINKTDIRDITEADEKTIMICTKNEGYIELKLN